MESNVDTSMVNVSGVAVVLSVVSGDAAGVVAGQSLPPFVPGVGAGSSGLPLGSSWLPLGSSVLTQGSSRLPLGSSGLPRGSSGVGQGASDDGSSSGGQGGVPPAFVTTVTLPLQPPNVPVM
ncbi:hypothetical protein LIER_26051 [Lithospermum erythrorhizon]|uniref:Uncharacterized protein n=1 Tax=Lithospermum erythrorhizon TaxID=34254 RepID=A0AAV3RB00_LITER